MAKRQDQKNNPSQQSKRQQQQAGGGKGAQGGPMAGQTARQSDAEANARSKGR